MEIEGPGVVTMDLLQERREMETSISYEKSIRTRTCMEGDVTCRGHQMCQERECSDQTMNTGTYDAEMT